MNDKSPTYQELFLLLETLGFEETAPGKGQSAPRVFHHSATDTILAFGREAREPITPADMLSTDVHLQGRGVVEQGLESLLRAQAVSG